VLGGKSPIVSVTFAPVRYPERIALPAKRILEPAVLHRRRLELVDERLHFNQCFVCARTYGAGGLARPALVCIQARFDGRGGSLNREELLLHRVVEITSEPCPFFAPRRLANLCLVSPAQCVRARMTNGLCLGIDDGERGEDDADHERRPHDGLGQNRREECTREPRKQEPEYALG